MSGNKIASAKSDSGVLIDADSYQNVKVQGLLHCPVEGCEAILSHVKGFLRVSYGRRQLIPAYFRLAPHSNHAEHCPHRTSGKQTLHVASSDSEITKAIKNGELIFRVHLMDSEEQKVLKGKSEEFKRHPPEDITKREYRKKGRKEPYVKSMNSLIEIYYYGESSPEKRGGIKLITDKEPIAWDNFFFTHKTYDRLLSLVHNKKWIQCAVIVKIKVIRTATKKSHGFIYIECSPVWLTSKNSMCITLKLSKNTSDGLFCLGSEMMVFGRYSFSRNNLRIAPIEAGVEIMTLVESEQQLYRL